MLSKPPVSLRDVIAAAIFSPNPVIPDVAWLIFSEIASTPIASMIDASAFLTRFPAFVNAVPMPAVAVRACSSKEANPSIPFVFRSTRAALNWSKETVPFFSAV